MVTLLLICALGMAHADCQSNTALHVIKGPDTDNQFQCMMQSQTYMASQKALVDKYAKSKGYLKIQCIETNIGQDGIG